MLFELKEYPTSELDINTLYTKYLTPEEVINHCKAVAKLAYNFSILLTNSGYKINSLLVRDAALLHDICKSRKNHEKIGSDMLIKEGLNDIAYLVLKHNDYEQNINPPDEAAIIYLADKMTRGTEYVSIEERFLSSYSKCLSNEAKEYHSKRYETSKKLWEIISPTLMK